MYPTWESSASILYEEFCALKMQMMNFQFSPNKFGLLAEYFGFA